MWLGEILIERAQGKMLEVENWRRTEVRRRIN